MVCGNPRGRWLAWLEEFENRGLREKLASGVVAGHVGSVGVAGSGSEKGKNNKKKKKKKKKTWSQHWSPASERAGHTRRRCCPRAGLDTDRTGPAPSVSLLDPAVAAAMGVSVLWAPRGVAVVLGRGGLGKDPSDGGGGQPDGDSAQRPPRDSPSTASPRHLPCIRLPPQRTP